ncbi:MAG: 6-phosphofructokinase [Candidatus Omnitrophica bacterium]|nr:6-phosphofructokinase [Candidatus Omnitrophota bacterium]
MNPLNQENDSMRGFFISQKKNFVIRSVTNLIVYLLTASFVFGPAPVYAQGLINLPQPGTMVTLSAGFAPAVIKGITIFPDQPLRFDFIVDPGDSGLKGNNLKYESQKLIKYFLASITVPEEDMWVNLSPYEKDRIIPDGFGKTEMGRDLLAQDYLLKQITASLMYPEEEIGKAFWEKVYKKANTMYGTTEVPVNTFNKVWIVPEKATVYENGDTVFVAESYLKVMLAEDYENLWRSLATPERGGLEEDYIALEHNSLNIDPKDARRMSEVSKFIIKEIIIPELEKEVNYGENFANLRQIYNSVILAAWYKKNLKESLLGSVYMDKNKVDGVDIKDPKVNEEIYQQYLEAFKVGAYNFIKEEYDQVSQQVIPRKYFSGGAIVDPSKVYAERQGNPIVSAAAEIMRTNLDPISNSSPVTVAQASKAMIGTLKDFYKKEGKKRDDYNVKPIVAPNKMGVLKNGDIFIWINHRGDRSLEVLEAFTNPNFNQSGTRFDTKPDLKVDYVPFATYDPKAYQQRGIVPAFASDAPEVKTVSDILVENDVEQGRFGETDKGSHVTSFYDGRKEISMETYASKGIYVDIVNSEGVKDKDKNPGMQYKTVAQHAVQYMERKRNSLKKQSVFINLAVDIQGHVLDGNKDRAVATVLAADEALGMIREKVKELGGVLIVTSDHGNVEEMARLDENGMPITDEYGVIPSLAHSKLNPVPFIVEGVDDVVLKERLGIASVEATKLDLLGIPIPAGKAESVLKSYKKREIKGPVVTVVLDGWGINRFSNPEALQWDAIHLAQPAVFNDLRKENPMTTLKPYGDAVGLPETSKHVQMGDSDNGHATMGYMEIVPTLFSKIMGQIETGEFLENKILREKIQKAIDQGKDIAIAGLISDGGVHSHYEYVMALLELCAEMGVQNTNTKIKLYAALDGRDVQTRVPTENGAYYLNNLEQKAKALGLENNFLIAMINGRGDIMDRDAIRRDKLGKYKEATELWSARFKVAYDAMVYGIGEPAIAASPVQKEGPRYSQTNTFDKFTTRAAGIIRNGIVDAYATDRIMVIEMAGGSDSGASLLEIGRKVKDLISFKGEKAGVSMTFLPHQKIDLQLMIERMANYQRKKGYGMVLVSDRVDLDYDNPQNKKLIDEAIKSDKVVKTAFNEYLLGRKALNTRYIGNIIAAVLKKHLKNQGRTGGAIEVSLAGEMNPDVLSDGAKDIPEGIDITGKDKPAYMEANQALMPEIKETRNLFPLLNGKPKTKKRIVVLTGGGPASGHNNVIYSLVKKAEEYGYEVIGIRQGWKGLYDDNLLKEAYILNSKDLEQYRQLGGTVLQTERFNPFSDESKDGKPSNIEAGVPDVIWRNLTEVLEADLISPFGGDDTTGVGMKFQVKHHKPSAPKIIAVPKTMDYDLPVPTYGYSSFTEVVAAYLNEVAVDYAQEHGTILVDETFGRNAGWAPLKIGMLTPAAKTFIPEKGESLQKIIDDVGKFASRGKGGLIITSEGFKLNTKDETDSRLFDEAAEHYPVVKAAFENAVNAGVDQFGHPKLQFAGDILAAVLEYHINKNRSGENRIPVKLLGKADYLFRSDDISETDLMMTTALGEMVVEKFHKGETNKLLYVDENGTRGEMPLLDETVLRIAKKLKFGEADSLVVYKALAKISGFIKSERERQGISDANLAEAVGITEDELAKIEGGGKESKDNIVKKMPTKKVDAEGADKQAVIQANPASYVSSPVNEKDVGGIDLNANNWDIESTGRGMDFDVGPFDPATLNMPVNGFTPVIFEMVPITNVPMFMGTLESEGSETHQQLGRL